MQSRTNRTITLAKFPEGLPTHEDFKEVQLPLRTGAELKEGEILVRNLYLSVDPYMRGRMRPVKSYVDHFHVGQAIVGGGAGVVEESKNAAFAPGDVVAGFCSWAEYTLVPAEQAAAFLKLAPNTNLEVALSACGMTGLTAYFGLLHVGKPKEGETVVVSGASGATGSIVGQIAKIKGCRVVGLAGSEDKVEWLKNLGFDAAINYKTSTDLAADIKAACEKGIDVYFDNVGGEQSDIIVQQMNDFGRVVHCGAISTYNTTTPPSGPRREWLLITKRLRCEGFIVSDFKDRFPEGVAQLAEWVAQGKVHHKVTVKNGIDHLVDAFLGLFDGSNIGKMLVKL